jgi:hypothetical protein
VPGEPPAFEDASRDLVSDARILTGGFGTSQSTLDSGRGLLISQAPGHVEHQCGVAGRFGVDRLDELAGPSFTPVSQDMPHVLQAQTPEMPALNRRWEHPAGVEVRVVTTL